MGLEVEKLSFESYCCIGVKNEAKKRNSEQVKISKPHHISSNFQGTFVLKGSNFHRFWIEPDGCA